MFPYSGLPRWLSHISGAVLLLATGACATANTTQSGFLSDYSRLEPRTDTVRAKVAQYRDDDLLATIEEVRIEPAVLGPGVGTQFSDEERAALVTELDRQICYVVSRRFLVVDADNGRNGVVRVAATRVDQTNAPGSAAAAVANFFIPGPIGVRVPGSTGGLAAEAELLAPDGRQAAAIIWAREAQVVGTDTPSLSRVGDAHKLAAPFSNNVDDALQIDARPQRPHPDPDPCERFGPRNRPEGFVTRVVTGLYLPELSGGPVQPQEGTQTTPARPDSD